MTDTMDNQGPPIAEMQSRTRGTRAALATEVIKTRGQSPAQVRVIHQSRESTVVVPGIPTEDNPEPESQVFEHAFAKVTSDAGQVTAGGKVVYAKAVGPDEPLPKAQYIPGYGWSIEFADGELWATFRPVKEKGCGACTGK